MHPVRTERISRLLEFRGNLDAGCTGADDGNPDGAVETRPLVFFRPLARVDEGTFEPTCLLDRIERERVLGRAFHIEVVGNAANGKDKGIVADGLARRDLVARAVDDAVNLDQPVSTLEAEQGTLSKFESMNACLVGVIDGMETWVERTRCDLVKQRLPQMGCMLVDQHDAGSARLELEGPTFRESDDKFQAPAPPPTTTTLWKRGFMRRLISDCFPSNTHCSPQ